MRRYNLQPLAQIQALPTHLFISQRSRFLIVWPAISKSSGTLASFIPFLDAAALSILSVKNERMVMYFIPSPASLSITAADRSSLENTITACLPAANKAVSKFSELKIRVISCFFLIGLGQRLPFKGFYAISYYFHAAIVALPLFV